MEVNPDWPLDSKPLLPNQVFWFSSLISSKVLEKSIPTSGDTATATHFRTFKLAFNIVQLTSIVYLKQL